jgi:hypothetical protein
VPSKEETNVYGGSFEDVIPALLISSRTTHLPESEGMVKEIVDRGHHSEEERKECSHHVPLTRRRYMLVGAALVVDGIVIERTRHRGRISRTYTEQLICGLNIEFGGFVERDKLRTCVNVIESSRR